MLLRYPNSVGMPMMRPSNHHLGGGQSRVSFADQRKYDRKMFLYIMMILLGAHMQ